MRLTRLIIRGLPGIDPGFALESIGPGVNIVAGPNAGGKSSVVRAFGAAIYPEESRGQSVHVEARLEDESGVLEAKRLGPTVQWYRNGVACEPPQLPDHRFLDCYFLRIEDLLVGEGDADEAIAVRLARDLAGGYDLRLLRDEGPFALKPRHGQGESRRLQEAERGLRDARGRALDLARREDRLASLRERQDAADAAERELGRLESALHLLESVRRRVSLDQRLREEFPEGMERLSGAEQETLAKLRRQAADHEGALEEARTRLKDAEERLAGTGLDGTDLDGAEIEGWKERALRLREGEIEFGRLRGERARAQDSAAQAARELGAAPQHDPLVTPGHVGRVEEGLREKRRVESELGDLEAEAHRLASTKAPPHDRRSVEAGRDALLQWLGASSGASGERFTVLAVLGAGALVLAAVAVFTHPAVALGAVLAVAAVIVLVAGRDAGRRVRNDAEERYLATGLGQPAGWTEQDVKARLGELDRVLVDVERALRARERVADLEVRLGELRQERRALVERLTGLAQEVGFDPQILDASFDRWVRLVADWQRARGDLRRLDAEMERSGGSIAQEREGLVSWLRQWGEAAPAGGEADATTLLAAIHRLEQRQRGRVEAESECSVARRDVTREEEQAEKAVTEIEALFQALGLEPGDDQELARRAGLHDEWKTLRDRRAEFRGAEHDRRRELADRDDLLELVDAGDQAGLEERIARLRAVVDEAALVVDEIAAIKADMAQAGRSRSLEEAAAARDSAADELALRLDEALLAEAGGFLLDEVEAEYVRSARPRALAQAQEWFARFTRHQFELLFGDPEPQQFGARETRTGQRRRLSELSSGTKTQLILAVRVAFALEAERGRSALPLFLDEALTTSDPDRFSAAAEALSVLAEEGRQVFYLTADPRDVMHWEAGRRPYHLIDLGRERDGQAPPFVPARDYGPPGREAAVPPSAGRTAAEYAEELGVPAVDLWLHSGSIHLFHLLRDDLELLERLLRAGCSTVGQAASLLDSRAAEHLLTPQQAGRLARIVEGCIAWAEARRRGRPRPIEAHALDACPAVSEVFLERVVELSEELGRDPGRLLDGLREGQLKGFRTAKCDELQEWLEDQGYLDDGPPPADEEILLEVLIAVLEADGGSGSGDEAAVAHPESAPPELIELARRVVRQLEEALASGF